MMKKFLIIFLIFFITVCLSVLLAVTFFQDRLIDTFKKQIIDKTSIEISYSKIRFSILKNFPYCSFTLDDTKIFYQSKNHSDTLIFSKYLSFKINTINLLRNRYEFPEIIISDATINLDVDKINQLISHQNKNTSDTSYLLETKILKLKSSKVRYNYKEKFKLSLYLDNSTFSGNFSPNVFSIRLKLDVRSLIGCFDDYHFKYSNRIKINSAVFWKNDLLFSENGAAQVNSLLLEFSFSYSFKNDSFQLSTKGSKLSLKNFCSSFPNTIPFSAIKGILSFDTYYDINFDNIIAQKLTISYSLSNAKFYNYKELEVINLVGTSTFYDNFNKNRTDINKVSFRFSGLEFEGSSKISNFSKPYILADFKFKNFKEINVVGYPTINGKISGNIKSLIKINDVKHLSFNSLEILKLNSDFTFSNLSFNKLDYLSNLDGNINIVDDALRYKGNGKLYRSPFECKITVPKILEVISGKVKPFPKIFLSLEKLNLDSIPYKGFGNKDNTDTLDFLLTANIHKFIYNDLIYNDLNVYINKKDADFHCPEFSVNAFSGKIQGNFYYSWLHGFKISSAISGINIHDLFKGFNNFGQSVIAQSNIYGTFSGKIDLSFKQLDDGKINPTSIILVSDLIVEKGKLIGVNQLKKVYKFLNINEADTIRFNTLQNKIDIENELIKIPSMSIYSNALNLNLSGQHNFNGKYIYWIKLNLHDILAKKYLSRTKQMSDYEIDNNHGLNLFIKIFGDNDKFNVCFDKKQAVQRLKENLNNEGVLLKKIINEEFKKGSWRENDSTTTIRLNKVDSVHNKNPKKTFRIEWDEIDSTKNF